MKRVGSWLIIISIIVSMCLATSCRTRDDIPLNEITYVEEGSPWYDMIKVEMDFEEYGTGYVDIGVILYADDYFTSVVSAWHRDSGKMPQFLEQCNYEGELISKIDVFKCLDDSFGEYIELADGYSDGGKDYIALKVQDENTWHKRAFVYEIDYSNDRLINQQEIDILGLIGDKYELCEISLSGDYIVYRAQDFDLNCKLLVVNKLTGESYVTSIDSGDHSFFWVAPSNTPNNNWDGDIYYTVDRESDSVCYKFNPETGLVTETNTPCDTFKDLILPDGTLVRNDIDSIYKTTIGSDDKEIVMENKNCAMSPLNYELSSLVVYSENHIVLECQMYSNSQGIQTSFLCILNRVDTNPHVGKQIVTVGYYSSISEELGRLIEKNNNSSDSEYFISLTDKYDWWKYVDRSLEGEELAKSINQARLNVQNMFVSDVVNGEAPDIVVGFGGVCAYTSNLVYTDLTPYVEGENGLDKEEYIDIVFCGDSDGLLYQIPFGAQMNGLEVPADLGEIDLDLECMTYSEYIDFINKHHNGEDAIYSFEVSYGLTVDDMEYFMQLWNFQAGDFISDGKFNITTGENAEAFKKLAEYVANRDVNFHKDEDSGKFISISETHRCDFFHYIETSYGKTHNVIGYPSYNGATQFTFTNYSNTIAITKCCNDKDAAWNIARQMFDYDIQCTFMDNFIPVNIAALNYVCDRTIQLIVDGTNTNVLDFNWDYTKVDLSLFKNQFIGDVKSMNTLAIEDQRVNQILREELPAYLEGQKSIEDVAAVIENRVNTYLDETR